MCVLVLLRVVVVVVMVVVVVVVSVRPHTGHGQWRRACMRACVGA